MGCPFPPFISTSPRRTQTAHPTSLVHAERPGLADRRSIQGPLFIPPPPPLLFLPESSSLGFHACCVTATLFHSCHRPGGWMKPSKKALLGTEVPDRCGGGGALPALAPSTTLRVGIWGRCEDVEPGAQQTWGFTGDRCSGV